MAFKIQAIAGLDSRETGGSEGARVDKLVEACSLLQRQRFSRSRVHSKAFGEMQTLSNHADSDLNIWHIIMQIFSCRERLLSECPFSRFDFSKVRLHARFPCLVFNKHKS